MREKFSVLRAKQDAIAAANEAAQQAKEARIEVIKIDRKFHSKEITRNLMDEWEWQENNY